MYKEIYRAIKYRIYPTQQQKELIDMFFSYSRNIYNLMLFDKLVYYKETGNVLNCYLSNYLESHPYLKDADPSVLRNSCAELKKAFNSAVYNDSVEGLKYKSKKSGKSSYKTFIERNEFFYSKSYVFLTGIGKVKFKNHKTIKDTCEIRSVIVLKKPSGKYFIHVNYFEKIKCYRKYAPFNYLGLDFSLSNFYIDSNGNKPEFPDNYVEAVSKLEQKLKLEKDKLLKLTPQSNNWTKQHLKVVKVREKIANIKLDFLHKHSRQIANAYNLVCVETLSLHSIAKKNGFGKSVYEKSWAKFLKLLEYKLLEQGKSLLYIPWNYPSSQLCSSCGYRNEELRNFKIKNWECPECHTRHNRDTNAAKNIKEYGYELFLSTELI